MAAAGALLVLRGSGYAIVELDCERSPEFNPRYSRGDWVSQPSSSTHQFGRYELVAHLATGGMAEIFLARERGLAGLERLVVIKRILPKLAHNASFIDMFLREARIVARLNHPNIIQIYELGSEAGDYFIAMEYVHGSTVREIQLLAEQRGSEVPVSVAVSIIEQACRGLHAAHQLKDLDGTPLGLIHRDVSPHNLMCSAEGFIKLLDFGVAKASQGSDATYSGHLKGKFAYMSPEQCQGQQLDRRADIFSLGVVVWETLTGERLFKRESDLDMMRAVIQEQTPAPSELNPEVPPAIDAVVLRALKKDRAQRFQSADEMRSALLEACRAENIHYGEDVLAKFLAQVAGDDLSERQATLQEALERSLSKREEEGLRHATAGSGSHSSLSHSRSGSVAGPTVIERPKASGTGSSSRSLPGRRPEGTPSRSHPSSIAPEVSARREPPAERSFGATHTQTEEGRRHPEDEAEGSAKKSRSLGQIISVLALLAALVVGAMLFISGLDLGSAGADGEDADSLIMLGEPLKIGWAPIAPEEMVSPEVALMKPYLERTMGQPIIMEVAPSYEVLSERLREGEYDFAVLPPLLYVQTRLADSRVQVVAFRQFGGSTSSDALLVTRANSSITSFEDLKGKRFCFTDRDSATGYFLPQTYIRRQGHDPDEFIGEVVWSGEHLQVLRDLLEDKCDVAATYSGSYLSADKFDIPITRIRIFAITGHVPQDTVAARPGIARSLIQKLEASLIAFDPQKELGTRETGSVLRISGFSKGSNAEFTDLREAVKFTQEKDN